MSAEVSEESKQMNSHDDKIPGGYNILEDQLSILLQSEQFC